MNLSVKINNINGSLKNGTILISHNNYAIGDKIYTTGLTNIPGDLLIGTVKKIIPSSNNLEDTITVDFIENNSHYIGILTSYA